MLTIDQVAHEVFARNGAELIIQMDVTAEEAKSGFEKTITCLDGSTETIHHPDNRRFHDDRPTIEIKAENRIDGSWKRILLKKGLPYPYLSGGASGRKGHLIVRARIVPPKEELSSIEVGKSSGCDFDSEESPMSPGTEFYA
jgi:DnaJ-class molecular chaperone